MSGGGPDAPPYSNGGDFLLNLLKNPPQNFHHHHRHHHPDPAVASVGPSVPYPSPPTVGGGVGYHQNPPPWSPHGFYNQNPGPSSSFMDNLPIRGTSGEEFGRINWGLGVDLCRSGQQQQEQHKLVFGVTPPETLTAPKLERIEGFGDDEREINGYGRYPRANSRGFVERGGGSRPNSEKVEVFRGNERGSLDFGWNPRGNSRGFVERGGSSRPPPGFSGNARGVFRNRNDFGHNVGSQYRVRDRFSQYSSSNGSEGGRDDGRGVRDQREYRGPQRAGSSLNSVSVNDTGTSSVESYSEDAVNGEASRNHEPGDEDWDDLEERVMNVLTLEDELDEKSDRKNLPVLRNKVTLNMDSVEENTIDEISKINMLQEYDTDWKLKLFVLQVGQIEERTGYKGMVKICKITLADDEGTRIQAVAFNIDAERIKENMEKGKTYIISNSSVKTPNKNYLSPHPKLELLFNQNTTVEEQETMPITLESVFKQFEMISTILKGPANKMHDLMGVVVAVKPVIASKQDNSSETVKRRDIVILDAEKTSCTITIWKENATKEGKELEESLRELPVVVLTNVIKKTYEGEDMVSFTQISTIHINPNIQAARDIKRSFEYAEDIFQLTPTFRRSIQVNLDDLLKDHTIIQRNSFCRFNAMICSIDNKDYPFYNACTTCNKSVELKDEGPKCGTCSHESITYEPRYMLRMTVSGKNEKAKLTLFEESAEQIIGCKAKIYIESMEKDKLSSPYYIRLVKNTGKLYTFIMKMDKRNETSTPRKCITISEAYKVHQKRTRIDEDEINAQLLSKKIKEEKK